MAKSVTRTQLSLYVPEDVRAPIEAVRALLDPVQAELIPAHVTLCREDELLNLDPNSLKLKLNAAQAISFTLTFGAPERFHEHGVLLPCVAGEAEFQALRRWLLGEAHGKHQVPHMTLAHPRNPKTSTNTMENASKLPGGLAVTFTTVSRIHQVGSTEWRLLETYKLSPHSTATPNQSLEPTCVGRPPLAAQLQR